MKIALNSQQKRLWLRLLWAGPASLFGYWVLFNTIVNMFVGYGDIIYDQLRRIGVMMLITPSLVAMVPFVLHLIHYTHLQRWRKRAAQGEQGLLADIQPVPQSQMIGEARVIELKSRARNGLWWWFTCVFIFMVTIYPSFIHIVMKAPDIQVFPEYTYFFSLIVGSLLFILAGIIFWTRKTYEAISYDERELRIAGKKESSWRSMLWRDARLFVRYYGPRQGNVRPLFYELIGEKQSLVWRFHLLGETKRLPEHYMRQIELFHGVIVAKTGLSLYDLTQEYR